jgi:hypothetical protein
LFSQLSAFPSLLDKISCLKTCVHQINSSVVNNYNYHAVDNDSDSDEPTHTDIANPSPKTRHENRFIGVTAEELLPMIIYCLIRSGLKSLFMDIQLASLANLVKHLYFFFVFSCFFIFFFFFFFVPLFLKRMILGKQVMFWHLMTVQLTKS